MVRERVMKTGIGRKTHPRLLSYNRTSHRLREIERIVAHRWGFLPDTDDADIVLDQIASCLLHIMWKKIGRLPEVVHLADRLKLWCERWAPDISIVLCRKIAQEILRRPRLDCADDCAARLRLSYEERTNAAALDTGIASEYQPEYWGFDTMEEWDAAEKKMRRPRLTVI
jgi:hypothetical protein